MLVAQFSHGRGDAVVVLGHAGDDGGVLPAGLGRVAGGDGDGDVVRRGAEGSRIFVAKDVVEQFDVSIGAEGGVGGVRMEAGPGPEGASDGLEEGGWRVG